MNIEKINIGMCSKTYRINIEETDFIIQKYSGNYKYHAKKKHYIYNLVKKHSKINVPNAIDWELNDNIFLISEKCPGELLSVIVNNMEYEERCGLFYCIGMQLATIHSSIPTENKFGWVVESGLKTEFNKFADYLNDEIEKIIIPTLKENLDNKRYIYIESKIKHIYNAIHHINISSLLWTDLNRNNIVVNSISNEYVIYWLDPAAARFGPPEWDIANAKIHLCVNESDYNSMIDGYKIKKNIEEEHIESFIDLVKICDLVLAYKSKNMDLFYRPYDYWFHK